VYGAKHSVPVAHIIIVTTLGNDDRDTLARPQIVANVRVSGVGGIFGKEYFMSNPIVIDPNNAITSVRVDTLGPVGNAINGYCQLLSFYCRNEN
jgi:hypothetical protein